jgi:hypothetical protein
LLSAGTALFEFLCSTMPVRYPVVTSEVPTGPSWIPAGLFVLMVGAALLVTLLMALLLLPLLASGFVHVRCYADRRLVAAWAGAMMAALALEVAYLTNFAGPSTSDNYTGPAVLNWAHLADAAGFLTIGAAMMVILIATSRASARPGNVSRDTA